MFLVKCSSCHHEWQQATDTSQACDWCGSVDSIVLDEDQWHSWDPSDTLDQLKGKGK